MPDALYMDATITPNRSLSRRGVWIVIGALAAVNLVTGTMFLLMGAPFVPVFLGLDVLGVWIAFRASQRAGWRERVRVSREEVRVSHHHPRMNREVWRSPTAWTQVELQAPPAEGRAHAGALSLRTSGRELRLAQALSPKERAAFAAALSDAIRRARRG